MTKRKLIIEDIEYNPSGLKALASQPNNKNREYLIEYPTVYVINDKKSNNFNVYVGESNNIIQRTTQHFNEEREDMDRFKKSSSSKMFVIGNSHFNKSLTLDIENQLMLYLSSVDSVNSLDNRRDNPQNKYYTSDEMNNIFNDIWDGLHKHNPILFPLQSKVENSAIFKSSPFHKLNRKQNAAKDKIINKVASILDKKTTEHKLILVEGDAGSGKTVLLSTIFYLLNNLDKYTSKENLHNLDTHLLVNNDEQVKVYEQIVKRLKLNQKNKNIVEKPTSFINGNEGSDVTLVDESHLLWTQGKQSYRGKNQLNDIIEKSKITIAIFDKHQILRTQSYVEDKQFNKLKDIAEKQGNHIKLDTQMRMNASQEKISWLHELVYGEKIYNIPSKKDGYELKIFDDVNKMFNQIKSKNDNKDNGLSRVVATFDWPYSQKHKKDGTFYDVKIGNFSKPWNLQLPRPKNVNKKLAWAEQKQTINEIGSTFTVQGFDLNYCGVIIGPSVKFRNGKIIYDPSESKDKNATQNRTMSDNSKKKLANELIPNELNVLLTRGVNGLYIYAVDEALRKELLKAQNHKI